MSPLQRDCGQDWVIHFQQPVPEEAAHRLRRRIQRLPGIRRVSFTGRRTAARLEASPAEEPDWADVLRKLRADGPAIREVDVTIEGVLVGDDGQWRLRTAEGDVALRPDANRRAFRRLCGGDRPAAVWVHGRLATEQLRPSLTVRCSGPATAQRPAT